jgi:hypothetical protein
VDVVSERVVDEVRSADMSAGRWPSAVSDGLTLACADCGLIPAFDYRVTDAFWGRWAPGELGVVCLPCLDKRSAGAGLSDALIEVQFTGTGHTVVLRPVLRHDYGRTQ